MSNVFCITGVNDTAVQEHYDEFFEEVFTELEDKVFSVCCAPKLLDVNTQHAATAVLQPFARDYPAEPVPEETLTHPPS